MYNSRRKVPGQVHPPPPITGVTKGRKEGGSMGCSVDGGTSPKALKQAGRAELLMDGVRYLTSEPPGKVLPLGAVEGETTAKSASPMYLTSHLTQHAQPTSQRLVKLEEVGEHPPVTGPMLGRRRGLSTDGQGGPGLAGLVQYLSCGTLDQSCSARVKSRSWESNITRPRPPQPRSKLSC